MKAWAPILGLLITPAAMADTYDEMKSLPGYQTFENICLYNSREHSGDYIPVRLHGTVTRTAPKQGLNSGLIFNTPLGKFNLSLLARVGETDQHTYLNINGNDMAMEVYGNLPVGSSENALIMGWVQRESAPTLDNLCENGQPCFLDGDHYDWKEAPMQWLPTDRPWRAPIQAQSPKLISEDQTTYVVKNVRWGTQDKGATYLWKTATMNIDKLKKVYLVKKLYVF